MSREQTYRVSIVCEAPYECYTRDVPYAWGPTADDIHHCIHRLREQAKVCSPGAVVKIASVCVVQVIDVTKLGICLTTINETKVL